MSDKPKHFIRLRQVRVKGLKGDYEAGVIAIKGLGSMLRSERPLRFHYLAHAVMLVVGRRLKFTADDWLLYAVAGTNAANAELNNSVHELSADQHLRFPWYMKVVKYIIPAVPDNNRPSQQVALLTLRDPLAEPEPGDGQMPIDLFAPEEVHDSNIGEIKNGAAGSVVIPVFTYFGVTATLIWRALRRHNK